MIPINIRKPIGKGALKTYLRSYIAVQIPAFTYITTSSPITKGVILVTPG